LKSLFCSNETVFVTVLRRVELVCSAEGTASSETGFHCHTGTMQVKKEWRWEKK